MVSETSLQGVRETLRESFLCYALTIMTGYGLLENRNGVVHGVGDAAEIAEIAEAAQEGDEDEGLAMAENPHEAGSADNMFIVKRDETQEEEASSESSGASEASSESSGASDSSESDSDTSSEVPRRSQQRVITMTRNTHGLTREQKIHNEAVELVNRRKKGGKTYARPKGMDTRWTIVLDGQNVAMHFNNKSFVTEAIMLAIQYFEDRGFRAYAILKDFVVESRDRRGRDGKINYQLPDDPETLRRMKDQGKIYTSPGFNHDDSFVIESAIRDNGLIVSNDLYRDYANNMKFELDYAVLQSRIISYSFINNKFTPNPEFEYPTYPDDFSDSSD